MNFTEFEQLFSTGGETNPLMMLVWILPVILFVFYGQRIQLYVTSGEIKKAIKKLDSYSADAKTGLLGHIGNLGSEKSSMEKVERFLDYFTILPVDMDPAGIVEKVKKTVRSREDRTREQVRRMLPDAGELEISKTQTLLEIASSLRMIHKIINHMFLTAKRQNNYPLILPLQMMLPFVMEHAEALKDAVPAFIKGQPVGDGIGPMVVGRMMLGIPKEEAAFQTVAARTEIEGRAVTLLKAEGPASHVGRPADALSRVMSDGRVDLIVMIDAALKMEGEESASVAHGFGAAIGGIGTERFEIEEAAASKNVPILSIVIKQTVKEAITLMSKEISGRVAEVEGQVRQMILDNAEPGQSVVVIGVGNTSGVPQ